ncbi:MAG: LytTR family DNA-binding domain-containing protein [Bacteroidota bacterium]
MRAIIVDDEVANIENLAALLNKHCPGVAVVASATNNADAAALMQLHQPDLLLLDIQLKDDTGFNLLRMLPQKTFEIIFVTAFDQYGVQAIKFAALDYLLKPIDIDELIAAINKADIKSRDKHQNQQLDFLLANIRKEDKQPLKIALPQQKEIRYVPVTDIIRCEADNVYTFFYLQNGERILVSKSLKEFAGLLEPNGFFRAHQTHLVNVTAIKSWLKEDGGTLQLNNGDKIPVSRPNRDRLKTVLAGLSV